MEPKRVLLIEDSPDDELLTRRAIEQTGLPIDIAVVHDGVEALAHFASLTMDTLPDLVLLDLKLPKVNGLEVLQQLRENVATRHLTIVVFTSSNEMCDICEASRFKANSYVRKPVEFHQFSAAVQMVCRYWLTINTPPIHQAASS